MRRAVLVTAAVVILAATVWALFWGLPRWYGTPRQAPAAAAAGGALAPPDSRTIRATLYYTSETGDSLVGVEREVPYGENTVEQARRILEAQIAPVQPPLLQAIPEATRVRTVFVTERGEAYVDLGPDVSTAHPGGSLDELLTVYAIVNALTVNLPAVSAVQILVDGKEVDTLAGHIDLRRPLTRNLSLVKTPES